MVRSTPGGEQRPTLAAPCTAISRRRPTPRRAATLPGERIRRAGGAAECIGHRTGSCRTERRQHATERASPPSTVHCRPVRAGRPPGSRGPQVPNRTGEQSALSMPLPRTNRHLARQASLHAFAWVLSRRSSGVFRPHERRGFSYIRATNVWILRNADCAACRSRVTPPAIHSTSRGRAAVSPSGKPLP